MEEAAVAHIQEVGQIQPTLFRMAYLAAVDMDSMQQGEVSEPVESGMELLLLAVPL